MSIEKFLFFWSNHNAAIIETLIALILVSVIYLAFRTFWGPAAQDDIQTQGSASFNSAEIEKTLQKILETQKGHRVEIVDTPHAGASAESGTSASGGSSAEGGAASSSGAAAASVVAGAAGSAPAAGAVASGAVAGSAASADEKEKVIEDLKKQLQQAKAAAAAASTVAAPAASSADTAAAEQKIKDLEARLSEYEIISEDIADLSFYKEENARLQKELATLKMGSGAEANVTASAPPSETGAVTPAPETGAAPAPAPAAETAAAAPIPEAAAPATVPTPEPTAAVPAAAAAPEAPTHPDEAAAKPPEAAPAAAAPVPLEATPMDDELMKEFAAAVETQKSESPIDNNVKVDKNEKLADNQNLLGEFENFMKKG